MTTGSRHLAAIMFTDIVGFTALAQKSESDAMRLLEEHNHHLRPFFARFHGREVKTMGDSFLVEFGSALDATNCAVEIQRSLRSAAPPIADRDPLRVRIGIHLGDVIASGTDVLGDAVNIASRIEPLAEPGGICVSAQVFDQVENKVDVRFEKLGVPDLKNVQVPIAVYRVVFPPSPPTGREARESNPIRRMAVLPFTNMSSDPQDEYFADGLTEEIITELSRIPNLRVIARTSVMRYKTVTKGVREIGTELRVGNVLEGSIRKSGNKIRITAQLIDAATEEHLWAERFDRELEDIFAVQADIASNVATALDLRTRTPPTASRASPPNVEAYTLYLRGRFLWNRRSNAAVVEAQRRFEEAIAVDPTFPLAHSGLADCYSILVDRWHLPAHVAVPKALAEARRGLELDPHLAEAHASLGLALANGEEFHRAEQEFRAAIELNPGYAMARLWLHLVLLGEGRIDEAGSEIAKAQESDPLSPAVMNSGAYYAWIHGRTDEALAKWDRAVELAAGVDAATSNRIAFYAMSDRRPVAIQLLEAYESGPAEARSKLWVGATSHAILGNRAEVERRLDRMQGMSAAEAFPRSLTGIIRGMLGDIDVAYEVLLDDANWLGGSIPSLLRTGPPLAKLRVDPRFETLKLRWEPSPAARPAVRRTAP